MKLCKDTLGFLIKNFEERLSILEKRKETPITLGRISELQQVIVYLLDPRLKL